MFAEMFYSYISAEQFMIASMEQHIIHLSTTLLAIATVYYKANQCLLVQGSDIEVTVEQTWKPCVKTY